MVKFHLSKNFGGLLKRTSCKTDFLPSMLDSKILILFLNCYSNIIEEKEGPHRLPNKVPIVGVHWAANCQMHWFNTLRSIDYDYTFFGLELACIADFSISFRPSGANTKDAQDKKEQHCYAVTCMPTRRIFHRVVKDAIDCTRHTLSIRGLFWFVAQQK